MDLGFMLIAFIFINVLVTSIAFIFKVPVSIWNFIVSSLLTLGMYVVIMRKHKYKVIEIAVCFGLFILSISGSMLLASNEYDISWDGNMYHKIAIGELSEGWNPIYQSIDDFNEEAEIKLSSTAAIWNDLQSNRKYRKWKVHNFLDDISNFFNKLFFLQFKK